jgi:hypothetical protein
MHAVGQSGRTKQNMEILNRVYGFSESPTMACFSLAEVKRPGLAIN